MFVDASVLIETDLNIDFSNESFIDPDTEVLIYKAQYLVGDIFIDLPNDFWLQFNSKECKFFGKSSDSNLYSSLTIKVIASDKYSEVEDTFTIKINRMPALYIINILVKIFGPLFAVLGMIKYKNLMINILFK